MGDNGVGGREGVNKVESNPRFLAAHSLPHKGVRETQQLGKAGKLTP